MKEMPISYHRILNRVEREEVRLLNRKPFLLQSEKIAALQAHIPQSVRDTLEKVFQKAFETLFSPGGTRFVERTYAKEKAEIQTTSRLLAERLLLVKFVQGLPVVGAVGGAANWSLSGAVSRYGTLKYKKRFLEEKVREL